MDWFGLGLFAGVASWVVFTAWLISRFQPLDNPRLKELE